MRKPAEADQLSELHKAARREARMAQSVDLAEELALSDQITEERRSQGGGKAKTLAKQAAIRTHRIAYYSQTQVMRLEVEYDGGDTFPSTRL